MQVMRGTLFAAATAMAVVVSAAGASAGAGAGAGARTAAADGAAVLSVEEAAMPVTEADVAHHGYVSLWDGRVAVWLESDNHGPSPVSDATVRLIFSVPPTGGGPLPSACLWGGDRVVLCRTGALRAGSTGKGIMLDLRVAGRPSEIVMDVATAWNGGAVDINHANDEHAVLVPATGDGYVF
ncbi:hypothetical protein ACFU5O_11090 [Streptomyces sp. NPDC057445]|uniref:hypothetical protein n=1 Tax=Streptomyces sp. NPDC057445 TaxID=3346136 RepID=UPI00369BFF56